MVHFIAVLLKFDNNGEKTGWTYIDIPVAIADQLFPGNRKSFRVKGKLDNYSISKVALFPKGQGDFVMPVNASMRKGIRKQKGAKVKVQLEVDKEPLEAPAEFMECLADEPKAREYYDKLPGAVRNYFIRWIESAKTDNTKGRRIACAINALAKGGSVQEMFRTMREENKKLL